MDHTHTQGDGIVWISDIRSLPAHIDLALIGGIEAIEDVHERAFTGAILPQQAQDLPFLQGQIDVIVRQHTGKPLGDPLKLQNRGHMTSLGSRKCTLGNEA